MSVSEVWPVLYLGVTLAARTMRSCDLCFSFWAKWPQPRSHGLVGFAQAGSLIGCVEKSPGRRAALFWRRRQPRARRLFQSFDLFAKLSFLARAAPIFFNDGQCL